MLQKPNINKLVFSNSPVMKELIESNKCVQCEKEIKKSDFKDRLAKKEYSISGLCQSCQDKIFNI